MSSYLERVVHLRLALRNIAQIGHEETCSTECPKCLADKAIEKDDETFDADVWAREIVTHEDKKPLTEHLSRKLWDAYYHGRREAKQ